MTPKKIAVHSDDRIQARRFRENSNASTTASMSDSKKKNCIYNCTYEWLEEQKKTLKEGRGYEVEG